MPFYKSIEVNATTTAYLWHITESYNELFRAVSLKDVSLARLEKMKSESHQKGFLAVRMLLQHIGFSDFDLLYDENGKPHLKAKGKWQKANGESVFLQTENQSPFTLYPSTEELHISISHSHEFSSICISKYQDVGIDLEKLKEKILRIAPKFMDLEHLKNLTANKQIRKATIIWGIKESIFKIKNEKGISFSEHIFEDEFSIDDKNCTAKLNFNATTELFHIQFYHLEDYIFVVALPK